MDEDDELVVLIENPDEPLRYDLVAAVNICPELALLMEEYENERTTDQILCNGTDGSQAAGSAGHCHAGHR